MDYLALASRAARAAGELLRDVQPERITSKTNPRDLVTEWDLKSEQVIRDVLVDSGIPVLGEEGGGERATTGARWLVDPIDGTVNFAHGLPIWAISIALEQDGVITHGVVSAPRLGWWFEATRGGGARDGDGNALHVSTRTELADSLLATGFPYNLDQPFDNFADWEHLYRRAASCRRFGAAALDLCLVARGWLDGYWERHLSPWDLAAGALIVVEAGGIVTDTQGGPLDVYAGEAVASNGAIHSGLLHELKRVHE